MKSENPGNCFDHLRFTYLTKTTANLMAIAVWIIEITGNNCPSAINYLTQSQHNERHPRLYGAYVLELNKTSKKI